jgi:hypothetical protein
MLSCKSCARAFRVERQQRIVSILRQKCKYRPAIPYLVNTALYGFP